MFFVLLHRNGECNNLSPWRKDISISHKKIQKWRTGNWTEFNAVFIQVKTVPISIRFMHKNCKLGFYLKVKKERESILLMRPLWSSLKIRFNNLVCQIPEWPSSACALADTIGIITCLFYLFRLEALLSMVCLLLLCSTQSQAQRGPAFRAVRCYQNTNNKSFTFV